MKTWAHTHIRSDQQRYYYGSCWSIGRCILLAREGHSVSYREVHSVSYREGHSVSYREVHSVSYTWSVHNQCGFGEDMHGCR